MRNHRLFLVDSSVWIEALSPRGVDSGLALRLQELRRGALVATTGMIRLELLAALSNAGDA